MAEYLTVQEALTLVLAGVQVMPAISVPLLDALGKVLAQEIIAHDSLPPFANSAMDGYAVQAADVQEVSPEKPALLRVIADLAAGSVPDVQVRAGTAARIMTGAPLPLGADAVVPVEDTNEAWRNPERLLPSQIEIRRAVQPNHYVRQAGEDIKVGEVVICAGTRLRPQEIGLMAALGYSQPSVIRPPRVAIIATGDELIEITSPLQAGKIRNSNSYTLCAHLLQLGATPIPLGIAQDNEADLRSKLQQGIRQGADLFISSAGVSVGAYDVVKTVLQQEGQLNFWRVRMRPGKPLAFGKYAGIPYLGLPGNPVSAAISFERFARPAILKMAGHQHLNRPQRLVTVQEPIRSDGRESYVRAIVHQENGQYLAVTTGNQGSHIMRSLVKANALLIIPEGIKQVLAGEQLAALMIDWQETVF